MVLLEILSRLTKFRKNADDASILRPISDTTDGKATSIVLIEKQQTF